MSSNSCSASANQSRRTSAIGRPRRFFDGPSRRCATRICRARSASRRETRIDSTIGSASCSMMAMASRFCCASPSASKSWSKMNGAMSAHTSSAFDGVVAAAHQRVDGVERLDQALGADVIALAREQPMQLGHEHGQDAGRLQQLERAPRRAAAQEAIDLLEHARRRALGDLALVREDRRVGLRLDGRSRARGELERAQDAHRILAEADVGIADGAHRARARDRAAPRRSR